MYSYRSLYILIGVMLLYVTCTVMHQSAKSVPIEKITPVYKTTYPARVHLKGGDVVIMSEGFRVVESSIGVSLFPNDLAISYDLKRKVSIEVERVDKKDIALIETFHKDIDQALLFSSIPGITTATLAAGVAIFGSCPTYYSFDGDSYQLEAEGFSYSIAPKLEVQDLDKLHYQKAIDGISKIEVRNEAYETHYIDQLHLISIDHDENYDAYTAITNQINPYADKNLLLASKDHLASSAISKSGEDITEYIRYKDEKWYRSPDYEIARLWDNSQTKDWIDLEFNVPEEKREVYLLMNLRNSLMNSVFFYDILLDGQNFGAIDWLNNTLDRNWNVYQFYKWYQQYFGMSIEIFQNGKYKELQKFGDLGPISWSERALRIPLKRGGRIRLRLKFMPDNWQVDWVGVTVEGRSDMKFKKHTFRNLNAVTDKLEKDDGCYFIQFPGNAIFLEATVSDVPADQTRSWFVRSTGYYTEWLRSEWLFPEPGELYHVPFKLSDDLINQLAAEWQTKKIKFETLFFESMIPVKQPES